MDGNISQTISRNNGDAEEEEDSEQEGNAGCNGRLTITDDIQRAAGVYITSGTSQEGHTTWPTKSQAEEGDAHVTNAEQTSLQARHGDGPECDPTGPTGTFVQTLTSPQKIADNTAPNSSAVTAQGPQPTEFVPTSTTASAESNYCYLPEAKISRQTLAPSSGSRDSRSNYICDNNQRPSVLETSVNNGTRKPSSESALSLFRTEPGNPVHKDGTTGASRNISVIDVTRESSVIKGRIKYADGKFPGVHSSMSSRSREISHQRDQILTSLVEGGQEPQADTGETITADIPQSLSTDSGIGSPPDGRTDIDPGVSLDMELGKDGKWKVENCPANSLAPRLVPSISYDRSENYRPCVEQSDAPSLSSPGDTSNYLSTLAPAHGQSIPGDGSSSHDSTLLDSLKTDEKRSLESDSRERLKENDVNLINTETILTTHFMSINHPENNSSLTEELAKTGQIIARKRNFGSDVEQNLDSSTCAGEEGSVATNISLTPEFAAELDTLDPVITTREKKSVLSSSSLSSASIESQSSSSKLLPDKGDVSHSLQYDQVREKFTKAVNNLHLTGQLPAAVTGSQVWIILYFLTFSKHCFILIFRHSAVTSLFFVLYNFHALVITSAVAIFMYAYVY